uniref:ATP synthase subunit a n=1 Tax=Gerrhopilus ceylonicus TaxID=3148149 RepID=A0PDN3_9SAUR|nr:ATPase subunit 6 [Gerrhopilus mirus]
MHLNMFDQFKCPNLLIMPTFVLPMLITILFIWNKVNLVGNRLTMLTTWFLEKTSKNLFSQLTPKGQKWAGILMALIMFILMLNLTSLLPYTFSPTSQLSTNMALAIPLWFGTVLLGLMLKPNIATAHLLPEGTPTILAPMLIIIETISLLIRPMALGVRLTANITAGHLLIHMISSTTVELMSLSNLIPTIIFLLLLALTLLEMAVACIQAYVFTLLISLYLEENS